MSGVSDVCYGICGCGICPWYFYAVGVGVWLLSIVAAVKLPTDRPEGER